MDHCPHCMTQTTAQVCPSCGKATYWQAPANQLPVGTLLRSQNDHIYQLGAAKGQGGFGITYAAMDLRTNTRVAIKEYFPSNCASRDTMTRVLCSTSKRDSFESGLHSFLQEARTLSSVGALESVVGIRDYFESNGTAYIVMEYVDGQALNDVLMTRGRMHRNELFPILQPLLRDLAILHRAGVIHRDISPDNLILTREGKLKLLDFGAARSTVGDRAMTVMLKAGFSPLEQYQSKGQGPYTDVYAMAGTIYYCLTGRVPPAAVDRIQNDELIAPNDLGAGLTQREQDALVWGMNVYAERRPQNVGAFATALLSVPAVPQGGYAVQNVSQSAQQGGHVTQNISQSAQQGGHVTQNISQSAQQGGHVSQNVGNSAQMGGHVSQDPGLQGGYYGQQGGYYGQNVGQTGGNTGNSAGKGRGKGLIIGIVAAVAAVVLLVSGLLIGGALSKKGPDREEEDEPTKGATATVTEPAALPGQTAEDTLPPMQQLVSEDGFTYRIEKGEAIITGYVGENSYFLAFPDDLDGCTVTVVDEGCLAGNTTIECVLLPIGCTEIRANAFSGCTALTEIGCYSTAKADPTAFSNCPSLRCVLLTKGDSVDSWLLPSGCRVFTYDMETGAGPLVSVEVDENGVIYGLTSSNENAVILDVPASVTYLEVPADIYGSPVTWMHSGALDNASGNLTVFMCPDMGFDYSLFDKAEWDFASLEDFSCSWYLTCAYCCDINAERGNTVMIMPDRLTVQASVIRAKEISTNYSHTRANGDNWSTVLDELGLEREYARTRNRKVDTAAADYETQLDAIILELEMAYLGTYDDAATKYYTGLGVSMYLGADGILYINIIGIA